MKTKRAFDIDVEKLRHAINVRNLQVTKMSLEMGREQSYMNTIFKSGRIVQSTAILLEKMYDIQPHEYELLPAQQEPAPEAVTNTTVETTAQIDYELLYNTIYGAILAALRRHTRELAEG